MADFGWHLCKKTQLDEDWSQSAHRQSHNNSRIRNAIERVISQPGEVDLITGGDNGTAACPQVVDEATL